MGLGILEDMTLWKEAGTRGTVLESRNQAKLLDLFPGSAQGTPAFKSSRKIPRRLFRGGTMRMGQDFSRKPGRSAVLIVSGMKKVDVP